MNRPKSPASMTAAAALVVAIVGGAVGGAVALSGGSDPAPPVPAEVRVDTVSDELAVTPAPSPMIEEEAPVTTPKPTPSATAVPVAPAAPADNAQESAERAKKEADRAEDAANRAEEAAEATPKPSPSPSPSPAPQQAAPLAAGNPCAQEGQKAWIGQRSNPRQTFECRNGKWVETTQEKESTPAEEPVVPS